MKSHVGRREAVPRPESCCSAICDTPIRFGVGETRVERVVQRVVDEGGGDTSVFVFWTYRYGTDVQRMFEGTSTSVQGKRETLRDAFAVVINDVMMDFFIAKGFEQLFGS